MGGEGKLERGEQSDCGFSAWAIAEPLGLPIATGMDLRRRGVLRTHGTDMPSSATVCARVGEESSEIASTPRKRKAYETELPESGRTKCMPLDKALARSACLFTMLGSKPTP